VKSLIKFGEIALNEDRFPNKPFLL